MTSKDIPGLVRSNIANLSPYSTARDEYQGELGILLDANESPYGEGLNRYPSTALRRKLLSRLAEIKGVNEENLFLGNGSDECIDLCYRVFCEPGRDNAVMIAPSYGMYSVCADINDTEYRQVPLHEDFSLPKEELLAAVDGRTKLIFLCSPNNPTANSFSTGDIADILRSFDGMLVLDEAYADFSKEGSRKALCDEFPNLIVLQTLSKAYGLAGLRIGLAIADAQVVSIFNKVRYPYNIGTDTLALALRQLDGADVPANTRRTLEERERLMTVLAQKNCISEVLPSDANFFLIRCARPAELYEFLLRRGIIVRDRSRTPGCGPALRITVGTPSENDLLLQAIEEYDLIQSTVH